MRFIIECPEVVVDGAVVCREVEASDRNTAMELAATAFAYELQKASNRKKQPKTLDECLDMFRHGFSLTVNSKNYVWCWGKWILNNTL